MIQIPDNLKPAIEAWRKYHFWVLLAAVPLIVLPMVFVARGRLAGEIDSFRGEIEGRLKAVRGVAAIQPHPNEEWSGAIAKVTTLVKRETLDEWELLWKSQQPLRVWPVLLGPDFLEKISGLKPGGKLPQRLLERYQNDVRKIVRTLPKRMGADESMIEGAAGGPGPPPAQPGFGEKLPAVLQWNSADQARLYGSFNWEKTPSTQQVLLAQEELWVYGVLADAIARLNGPSAAAYNAAIPSVEHLAVGYPAAEDRPGAVGGRRIFVPAASGQAGPPVEAAPPDAAAVVRPSHPRFGGGPGGPGGPGGEAPAAAAADDLLRNWVYVDFAGKPLMAAELATSSAARLVHLMPFVIRATVDDRKLDALLVELASAPVPIEVRQVRINPTEAVSGPGMPGVATPRQGPRLHDVTVELRGTVALATFPDRSLIGLAAGEDDGDDESEAAAVPEAPPQAEAGGDRQ